MARVIRDGVGVHHEALRDALKHGDAEHDGLRRLDSDVAEEPDTEPRCATKIRGNRWRNGFQTMVDHVERFSRART